MVGEIMDSLEIGSEHVPTVEEVHAVFQKLIGKEYNEVRKFEDENGLYLLEVSILGESPGEITQYEYMRKGRYLGIGGITATEIHVSYYNKNTVPVSGTSAAKLVDGEWKIIK